MTVPAVPTGSSGLPFEQEQTPWEELGLEEVEAGVFDDTFENRQALTRAGHAYEYVSDIAHEGQHLIRVIDDAEKARRRLGQHHRYRNLLTEPKMMNSDYVSPHELPNNADVPHWVRQAGRKWATAVKKGFDPAEHGAWLPTRCRYVRRDGIRCWLWSGTSVIQHETGYCRHHNGTELRITRDETLAKARSRIWQSAPEMVAVLERLATSAEAEPVRLRAATELLDRAGIRGGTELDISGTVEHVDAASQIRERLAKLGALATPGAPPAGVIEGETVESPPELPAAAEGPR